VNPSLETLRELLRACGFDLEMQLVRYEPLDGGQEERMREALARTPQERLVPSSREENLQRLTLALAELNARRRDGTAPVRERDLTGQPVVELETDAGEVRIVSEPAGTRGYTDLRRGAQRQPLGRGLRPHVASIDDHARMLAALAATRTANRSGSSSG
jgi:hypothetical protein